jgi:hypothetical protein
LEEDKMANPRPPIIISNGSMVKVFQKRMKKYLGLQYEPSLEVVKDILYGDPAFEKNSKVNGFATIGTYNVGKGKTKQFVYWGENKTDTFNTMTNSERKVKYGDKFENKADKESKIVF